MVVDAFGLIEVPEAEGLFGQALHVAGDRLPGRDDDVELFKTAQKLVTTGTMKHAMLQRRSYFLNVPDSVLDLGRHSDHESWLGQISAVASILI